MQFVYVDSVYVDPILFIFFSLSHSLETNICEFGEPSWWIDSIQQ